MTTEHTQQPVWITTHAIERYRLRFAKAADKSTAHRELRELFALSKRVGADDDGRAIFEGPPPACMRLIVDESGRTPSIVTVLYRSDQEWLRAFDDERRPPRPSWSERRRQAIDARAATLDRPSTPLEFELVRLLRQALDEGLTECRRLRSQLEQSRATERKAVESKQRMHAHVLVLEGRIANLKSGGRYKASAREALGRGELRASVGEAREDGAGGVRGDIADLVPRVRADRETNDRDLNAAGPIGLADVEADESHRDSFVGDRESDGARIDRVRDGDLDGDARVHDAPSVTAEAVLVASSGASVCPATDRTPTPPRGYGDQGGDLGARDVAPVNDAVQVERERGR